MEAEAFKTGKYTTHFIEENKDFLFAKPECDGVCEDIVLIASYLEYSAKLEKTRSSEPIVKPASRWKDSQRGAFI
jgi:acetyl-CoA carboxylase biotin carboxylase subunit